jgi:hypothetical protein
MLTVPMLTLMMTSVTLVPLTTSTRVAPYFDAGTGAVDETALGGFSRSENRPLRIDRPTGPDRVSLIAFPSAEAVFREKHRGFLVTLENQTGEALWLNAVDSKLRIVREARDFSGQWKAVESLPTSWCGNSYHRVALPANHYWAFVAPVYDGSMRTMMRFVLRDKDRELVSNEFEGMIDPLLFDDFADQ